MTLLYRKVSGVDLYVFLSVLNSLYSFQRRIKDNANVTKVILASFISKESIWLKMVDVVCHMLKGFLITYITYNCPAWCVIYTCNLRSNNH